MFRRLVRHFARGLVDNDLISRDADLGASIAGILSAFLVVSGGAALTFMAKYDSVAFDRRLGRIPLNRQTLADKLAMALDDKALLVGGAMILMSVIVVLWWDALVLDERDAEVLGPLPVRPSTVLAAKAAATTGAALLLAVVLNALPAVLFPVVVLLKTSVGVLDVLREIVAHAAASVAGCAFVFLVFACARTLAALVVPRRTATRLLPAVQIAFVLGLVATLFALPALAARTRGAIDSASGTVLLLPWTWFVGLQEVLAGRQTDVLVGLSRTALAALAIAGGTALALHLLSLRLRLHRTATGSLPPRSRLAHAIAMTTGRLGSSLMRDGRARAAFFFTARTITRHPRHRLYLAAAFGVGIAVACATIAAAHSSGSVRTLQSIGLAAQLNLIFFAVVGLRMAAALPADIDAGWTFRFHVAPVRERYIAGTRAAIFFVIVLPMLVVLAPLHAWLWGGYTALVHFAFGVVAALGLLEVVFIDYRRMPFVSSFVPGPTILAPRIVLYAIDYALFAYLTPAIELLLIERTGLLYAWVALVGIVVARLIGAQAKRLQHRVLPEFDHGEPDVQGLNLWDATPVRTTETTGAAGSRMPDLFETFGGHAVEPAPPEPTAPRAGRTLRLGRLRAETVHALRRLAAQPGFTGFSVLTLALGIAATTALYSVLYATILKPLPIHDLGAVVNVYHTDPTRGGNRMMCTLSLPDYEDFARQQHVFSSTAAHVPFVQVMVANGVGVPTRGELVTGRYFDLLDIRPLTGRLLQPGDDVPGAPRVAVIDERTWRRRFDGAPDIVGRRIALAGHAFEVIGVTPAGFHGVELPNIAPTEIWLPLSAAADLGRGDSPADREFRWLGVKARLAAGRTLAEARADVRTIAAQLDAAQPIGVGLEPQFRSPPLISRSWVALPAADRLLTEQNDPAMRRLAALTMIATGLVLLVACTNLSNLTLAGGLSRRRDIAVRLALGASRWDVVREQLVEHAIVAGLAAVTAFIALRLFVLYGLGITLRFGPWVAIDAQPVLDAQTLVAGALATGLSLVVAGLLPTLSLSRGTSLAHASVAPQRWKGRRVLIASQVAVSVALVALAGLCVRHIVKTASIDTGIELDRLAFARFDFRVQGWDQARSERALEQALAQAAELRGVESAAIAAGLPRRESRFANVTSAERPFKNANDYGTHVSLIAGTPALLRTLGVPVIAGRAISADDTRAQTRIVVLSESAALRIFTSPNIVGRRLLRRVGLPDGRSGVETLVVAGVARDTTDESGQRIATAYVPLAQDYQPSAVLIARSAADPAPLASALRTIARRVDPELGVIESGVGAQLAGTDAIAFQIMGALAGTLGTAAMVLSMIGLYGVLSFVIAQRTREIGIRIALGATAGRITRLVLGEGVRPVIEGLIIGFVIADIAEMLLRPALQKPLPAVDGSLLVLVPVPFLLAAVVACYLPSRRAAAVEPAVVLRSE